MTSSATSAVVTVSAPATTIHASAVLVGERALLIRGASASGKSHLALALLMAGDSGILPFTRLVGDDRIFLEARGARLVARPAEPLRGLIEVRGLGVRALPYEPAAVVGWVIDLGAADADRLPAATAQEASVDGIRLARLPVAPGVDALPPVLALLRSTGGAT